MPILGIIASQNYPRITNSYESIQTVTVGSGGQSTISFTSIPATFKHLQIRYSSSSITNSSIRMQVNGANQSADYNWHWVYGDGTNVGAEAATPGWMYIGKSYPTYYGAGIVDILDYANTNKYKTIKALLGINTNNNGGEIVALGSGVRLSTTTISSITITADSNFAEFTKYALYGIKG